MPNKAVNKKEDLKIATIAMAGFAAIFLAVAVGGFAKILTSPVGTDVSDSWAVVGTVLTLGVGCLVAVNIGLKVLGKLDREIRQQQEDARLEEVRAKAVRETKKAADAFRHVAGGKTLN